MSAIQITIRVAGAIFAYAITAAALVALSCVGEDAAICGVGLDAYAPFAIPLLALLLIVAGVVGVVFVLVPVVLLIARQIRIRWWFAAALGAGSGVVPVAIPCFEAAGGCVVSDWTPQPLVWLAVAGACGGAFLWQLWFRHLTTRSSGP